MKPMSRANPMRRSGHRLVCIMCTALVMAVAFSEIKRVEHGRLFAFALPWEKAPSEVEVLDARMSAQTYLVPALLVLAVLGAVVAFAVPSRVAQTVDLSGAWRTLAVVFLLAVLADVATTVWFFHACGIDHELHPGIRLFGYAYGRTMGPLAGKAVQAAGVLGLSVCLVRGEWLLLVVTLVYSIGAAYNILQMEWSQIARGAWH